MEKPLKSKPETASTGNLTRAKLSSITTQSCALKKSSCCSRILSWRIRESTLPRYPTQRTATKLYAVQTNWISLSFSMKSQVSSCINIFTKIKRNYVCSMIFHLFLSCQKCRHPELIEIRIFYFQIHFQPCCNLGLRRSDSDRWPFSSTTTKKRSWGRVPPTMSEHFWVNFPSFFTS